MKAIVIHQPNTINDLQPFSEIDIDKPVPKGKDILVKIKAISINPADLKVKKSYKSENNIPKILGWDAVGIVDDIGNEVLNFKVGDEVYYAGAIDRPGSYAEYQLVDERIVAKKPRILSYANSAAYPLVSLTAWEALFDRLMINNKNSDDDKGESILIIGGAGGVGSIAIQLIKILTKIKVIATASRPESTKWVHQLGADHIINHHNSLVEQFKNQNLEKIKYVFSTNSTERYVSDLKEILQPQGKLVLIDDPDFFDVSLFKAKSISINWEFMFTRSLFQTKDLNKQSTILEEISNLIEKSKIKNINTLTLNGLSVQNIEKAHSLLETNSTIGKITIIF